jgi:hypothetical protein
MKIYGKEKTDVRMELRKFVNAPSNQLRIGK